MNYEYFFFSFEKIMQNQGLLNATVTAKLPNLITLQLQHYQTHIFQFERIFCQLFNPFCILFGCILENP